MSESGYHVLDLGKFSRKSVKQFKKDRSGKLAFLVEEAISDALLSLGPEAAGKEIIPVIFLYQKKPKKPKLPLGPLALLR